QDAYNMRKPILGICYGLQILNVYQSGNLLQHIESTVNHEAGRTVPVAHDVVIEPESKLAEIVGGQGLSSAESAFDHDPQRGSKAPLVIPANSSHHQAAGSVIGDGLRVVARCPEDGIIEALEGTSPE